MNFKSSLNNMSANKNAEVVLLDGSLSGSDLNTVLIGTLISKKEINRDALINVLKMAWVGLGEVQISNIKKNKFMFVFKEKFGAVKALKNAPWTINGSWLALKEWYSDQTGKCGY